MPERVVVWKAATAGFLEKPILGWGLENFDLMFYRHFDPSILVGPGRTIGPPWFDRAHNIVLDLLVTAGVLGFAAFSLTMVASVFALGGAVRRNGFLGSTGFVVFTALFLSHFVQNLTVFDTVTSLMLLYASFAYASHGAPGLKIPSLGFQNSAKTKRTLVLAWACSIPLLVLAYSICVHSPRAVGRIVGALDGRPDDSDALADYIAASSSATVGRHEVRVRLAELTVNRLAPSADPDFAESRLREVDYVLAELEKSAGDSPTNFQIPFIAGRLGANTSVWLFENFSDTDWSAERALRYVNASISSYRRALE